MISISCNSHNRIDIAAASMILFAAALAFFSCSGEGDLESRAGTSFDQINVLVFQPRCALSGCHDSASRAADLNLSGDSAFGELVNVFSTELPSMLRVAPGDPEASYLVHKIRGTAGAVGGVDTQMPLGEAPLSDEDMDAIVQWIQDGAQP